MSDGDFSQNNSVTSEKLKKISESYSNIDAWLYAFPTPREFLKFFSKKLIDLETHYGKVLDTANEFKDLITKETKQHENISFYTNRIHNLEENVHDLRSSLHDERDNYIKLISENERLRIQSEDYRRKFQAVLLMSKLDERDVTLFMQKNPKAAALTDRMVEIKNELRECQGPKKKETELLNPMILLKQVKALELEVDGLTRIQNEHRHIMHEELKLLKQEKKLQKEEYDNRLKETVSKLMETKSLLHNLVLENVFCGQKLISNEQNWIDEREKLLQLVTHSHSDNILSTSAANCLTRHGIGVGEHIEESRRSAEKQIRLETELIEKENLVDQYKIKLIRMEKQVFRTQQLNDQIKKIHSEDVRKLTDRNKTLQKRLDEIDARRKLDHAGFREEIKGLKVLLTALQRRIRYVDIRKQAVRTSEKARASTAPADLGGQVEKEEAGSEEEAKEGLTWEALNQLLVIAAERVNDFERRIVKLGIQQ